MVDHAWFWGGVKVKVVLLGDLHMFLEAGLGYNILVIVLFDRGFWLT